MSASPVACMALALTLLSAGGAWADEPDAGALMLADEAPGVVAKASDWRTFLEGAIGGAVRRSDGSAKDNRRWSLDIQYDHSLSPDWRAFLADRLDRNSPPPAGSENSINTLKEVYLSWRAQPETLLDIGRINVHNGVAMGYNPTDYFRRGALRSVVSISPASLKENRQGSVMLRGQRLWQSSSLTMLYSPGMNPRPSAKGFSLDLGATNRQDRWLVAVSQKIGGVVTPQFLVYWEDGLPSQFGLNLTGLIDDATVAHVEWSGGRSPALLAQALGQSIPLCGCNAWRNQLAAGLSYTTPSRISLTAEYHYHGGALDRAAWDALRQGPLPNYGQYRGWLQWAQEPPTKQSLFFHATWQDALVNGLDVSAMHNHDLADSSRRTWLEARYRVKDVDYAVQWQLTGGPESSNFGAAEESRSWQAAVRYYF